MKITENNFAFELTEKEARRCGGANRWGEQNNFN